ncbi:MAG: hypothetical protein Q4A55_00535 [Aerococcus sp.]|nr:hypothetical protein [Aerococcus sp.]
MNQLRHHADALEACYYSLKTSNSLIGYIAGNIRELKEKCPDNIVTLYLEKMQTQLEDIYILQDKMTFQIDEATYYLLNELDERNKLEPYTAKVEDVKS